MLESPLIIRLFGPLSVKVHGEPIPRVRTRSVEWLLAVLALRHGRAVDRNWLAGTLWPDSEESRALHNLRDILVHLRKALGPERARIQSPTWDTLTLDLEDAELDVSRFDLDIRSTDEKALRRAVEIHSGPLLEGWSEEWVVPERVIREQACLRALQTLAESADRRKDYSEALTLLSRMEAIEPLRDSTQRGLMRALAASGDAPAALHSYREYRVRLRDELNVDPDKETSQLYQEIRTQTRGLGERKAPSLPGPSFSAVPTTALPVSSASVPPARLALPSTLPHPITTLIGREEETREVLEALSRSRLVTLTGGGGVGKTRLAIHAASQSTSQTTSLTDSAGPEAAFVSLASVTDPDALPAFLAESLGFHEEAGMGPIPLTQALTRWLSQREVLLVLDNCEHLIAASAALARSLLEHCPALTILATSRQRLGLTGEIVWRVRQLALPDLSGGTESILRAPAVKLFLERAAMAQPDFRLAGPEEAEIVARICQRLDGIPLAIELAAARTSALSLNRIAERLDDRFRLLTGSRVALPRHQTLRALIDWSYDLLSGEEKRLFRALSVFSGGWTLEAAETLLEQLEPPKGGRPAEQDALDLLSSLADKSLVLLEKGRTGPRYRMLESMREYGHEKLREAGGEEAAHRSHLACMLEMAERESRVLFGPEPDPALNRLQAELDNLRAALAFAHSDRAPEGALLRLSAALWLFWHMRSYFTEGHVHLRAALSREPLGGPLEAAFRARALLGTAVITYGLRGYPESAVTAEESLALFRSLGDAAGTAAAILHLGLTYLHQSRYAEVRALVPDMLAACRAAGWVYGSAIAHLQLAAVAQVEGDEASHRWLLEEAHRLLCAEDSRTPFYWFFYSASITRITNCSPGMRPVLDRCLVIARQVGEKRGLAVILSALGELSSKNGDVNFGRQCNQEASAIHRETGNYFTLAYSLQDIGNWHYREKDYLSASTAYSESLELFRRLAFSVGLDTASNTMGSTLFHLGQPERAAELHREALSHFAGAQNVEGIAWSLERLAVAEAGRLDPRRVATILGAADRARQEFGKPMDPWDQVDFEHSVILVRTSMQDDAAFNAHWHNGRAFTTERAILLALE